MIEPLPNCFSIWASASSSAFTLSIAPPSTTRNSGLLVMAAPPYGMRETFSILTHVYTICSCWGRGAGGYREHGALPLLVRCSGYVGLAAEWKARTCSDVENDFATTCSRSIGPARILPARRRPESICRLANASPRGTRPQPSWQWCNSLRWGILDFRGSTSAYTEVCLVEIDEAGVYGFPPGINQKPPALLGKELCAGWRPRRIALAFVGSGPNGDVHAFSTFTFSELPTNTIVDRSRRCAPLRRAVLQCVDAGPSGTHCGFVDGLGG